MGAQNKRSGARAAQERQTRAEEREFKDAYRALYGENPVVVRRAGWYYVNMTEHYESSGPFRLSQLGEFAERLRNHAKEKVKG